MCDDHFDALWRGFPKTLPEFEERFPNEQAARAYWADLRWNGRPSCGGCGGARVWLLQCRPLVECRDCGRQTSLTAGTLLHGTRKPIKLWFRAVLEMCIRRNGVSAKDLQRIMGFGSYETAWVWLHKIRRGLLRNNRDPLAGFIQLDESFIGGKGSLKEMIFVGAEVGGRVRLAHAPNNDTKHIKTFVDAQIDSDAAVTTDGFATYTPAALGEREHKISIQSKAARKQNDAVQCCHWAASLLKRWLLGTHHGAVRRKHLQAYLDEYAFRHNRRNTKGPARIAARALEGLVRAAPLTMRQLVNETTPCRMFA